NKQAVVVVLPDKQVTQSVGRPFAGSKFYYSGAANNLATTMTRTVTVPAGGATLTAKVRYNIEAGYDYAYVAVGGTKVETNLSNSKVVPEGIDGVSQGWVDLTVDLSAYAGKTVSLSFGYMTDGGVQGQSRASAPGFAVDDITLGGVTDGAESDAGWAFQPVSGTAFHVTNGTEKSSHFNAYVAESRQYVGYDANLKTGPYNFGGTVGLDWAERFPYQNGLLVWYYDSSYSNNNVGDHPGEGQILPVDANPGVLHWQDGSVMRGRIQSYDATFGLQATPRLTLHKAGVATVIPSHRGVSTFDDSRSYWVGSDAGDAVGHYQAGWLSVKNPHSGTKLQVLNSSTYNLDVRVTAPQA
ncbi:MAG: hypothetical protein ACTHNT_07370, partial [Actinomycetales bacterium]